MAWDIGADEYTIGGSSVDITVPVATLGLNGYIPTVSLPSGGAWDIGADELVTGTVSRTPPDGALTLTGYAPSINAGGFVSPPAAVSANAISSTAVTVTWTDAPAGNEARIYQRLTGGSVWTLDAVVDYGDETHTVYYLSDSSLYEFAVSHHDGTNESVLVTDSAPAYKEIPAGSSSFIGYAPTVTSAGSPGVEVPVGSMAVQGYTPFPGAGNPQSVTVPVGSIAVTGYVPVVYAGGLVVVTDLTATADGTSIDVAWTDTNGGSIPYRVYYQRTNVDSTYTLWETTATGATSSTIAWCVEGATYSVKVVAYDDPDEGPPAYDSATVGTIRAIAAAFV